CMQSLEFPVTF
nr:immunoglobulin light chain junction region [Macaca mulatta]MOX52270.1 immunoglobulin light chain junction region [Macaca mulatta]MOX52307.1 immunoglobulin light chain junction region [Macaca mulatta]MOX52749.1 immunoglobulin light chain junction region [Macaca mulatta]MOX52870.1 immunoglobulin light chain junction region [Macaca mulatta]